MRPPGEDAVRSFEGMLLDAARPVLHMQRWYKKTTGGLTMVGTHITDFVPVVNAPAQRQQRPIASANKQIIQDHRRALSVHPANIPRRNTQALPKPQPARSVAFSR